MTNCVEVLGLGCFGVYILTAWALAIASFSWMIHEKNTGHWQNKLENLYIANDNQIAKSLSRSWSQEPFTDIIVFYADPDEYLTNRGVGKHDCPAEYPEDVVYNFWPGATVGCVCLDVDGEREITARNLCSDIKTEKEIKRQRCSDI